MERTSGIVRKACKPEIAAWETALLANIDGHIHAGELRVERAKARMMELGVPH